MVEMRDYSGDILAFDEKGFKENTAEIMLAKFDGRLSRVESNSNDLKENLKTSIADIKKQMDEKMSDIKSMIESSDRKIDLLTSKNGITTNYLYDAMKTITDVCHIKKDIVENVKPAIERNAIQIEKIYGIFRFMSTVAAFLAASFGVYFGFKKRG